MSLKRALWFILALLLAVSAFSQTRFLLPYGKIQFFDRNGKPLAFGKVATYVAGTTTPKATYSSSTGAANTNPVILDAAGRSEIWLDADTSYKIILKDRYDVQQWSVDNITDWGGSLTAGGSALAGDVTGAYNATVVTKIQGIAVSTTDPTANQVLVYTGGAWTPGSVGVTNLSGILSSSNGGTDNGFTAFTGPASSEKTFTLPNASDTIATYAVKNVFTKAQIVTPSNLTINAPDGTVAVDASLSNHFRLLLTTDCPCTISTPSNPTDGQEVLFEITQATGGSETLDWSAGFAWGGVSKPTMTSGANKKDFVKFVYNSTATKWYALLAVQGY